MSTERRVIRCAVYTRKSSEEGLDQDFNSLDAQSEACLAYIASQKHEGWKVIPSGYDDGGFSGGNLERPGLVRLFADIDAGKVDMVVVYKIDRLTRSLMDFSKLVERLEKANCSFVSVTQSFNTSTSMGRLVLNVLLSFAQFEREVTAERIRDKIAASKKKGMWMGGIPPLGYAARDRHLIIAEAEAAVVRRIFDLYLEHRCIVKTKVAADALGLRSRPPKGKDIGTAFTRGGVYWLLTNPIYVGEIRHKQTTYPGLHPPLIAREVWDCVQAALASNTPGSGRGRKNAAFPSPLAGKVFDEDGHPLTPTHSGSAGKRHRYYVSRHLIDPSATSGGTGWRLPAARLEEALATAVRNKLGAPTASIDALPPRSDAGLIRTVQARLDHLVSAGKPAQMLGLVRKAVIAPTILRAELADTEIALALGVRPADLAPTFLLAEAPLTIRRCGVETRLLVGDEAVVDPALLKFVARAFVWRQALLAGKTLTQLADDEGVSGRWITSHLPAAYLAPEVVEQIIQGRQPSGLTVTRIRSAHSLPLWADQRRQFGLISG